MDKLKKKFKMNTKRAPMDVDKEFNSESCRICLTPNDKMSNIFARTLLTKIEYCTGIKIKNEDGLPTKICKSCQTSLTVAHKFKKLCLLTEQICRNVLESNIKTEQTHDASKIVNNNSNEDYLNDGWLKQDQSNNNFNGDCLKKDNLNENCIKKDNFNENRVKGDRSNDNFNENCVTNDHSEDKLNEKYLDNDYFKENFNGDKINDNSDNVLNDVSDQDNDLIKNLLEILRTMEKNVDRTGRRLKHRNAGGSSNTSSSSVRRAKSSSLARKTRMSTETQCTRKPGLPYARCAASCSRVAARTPLTSDTISRPPSSVSTATTAAATGGTWSNICSYTPVSPSVFQVCGKLFASRGAYSSHIRYHLPPSFFSHLYSRCAASCSRVAARTPRTSDTISRPPSSVSTATTAAATGGTWSNICSYTPVSPSVFQVCGKLFASRGAYSSHIRYHLPPSFFCEHCDYRSSYRWDLVKHLLIHTGIKQYQCSQCPNNYYTVSNLREHERVVHERVLRYACDVCGKMFYDRTHLRRHVDSHSDIKRFECEVCHSAFTRRCHWKKHLLKQHGITIPAQRPGRVRVGATGDSLAPDAADAVRRLRINHI
ncbi:zinc finger protein 530-like [Maniola hyperantus]|uniref:zinc finger protein 530-like n=1 Tax=Aphantopus hyperantus TaxID=2795564 RepID=UPI0037491A98